MGGPRSRQEVLLCPRPLRRPHEAWETYRWEPRPLHPLRPAVGSGPSSSEVPELSAWPPAEGPAPVLTAFERHRDNLSSKLFLSSSDFLCDSKDTYFQMTSGNSIQ